MILDTLEGLTRFFGRSWWPKARAVLEGLTPAVPDQEIPVQGRDLYVRVLTYDTVTRDQAVLEAHRAYVDVQVALQGREGIAVWPTPTLQECVPYDPARDVAYYTPPDVPAVSLTLGPGLAAVFFPEDAHMPQLIAGAPERVKKAVVKVRVTLLGQAAR